MKKRKPTTEVRDNGATAGELPNGDETGLTEDDPQPTLEVSNGSLTESSNRDGPAEPANAPVLPPPARQDPHEQLEDRIRRLEDALALLNEMKERQAHEVAAPPAPAPPQPPPPLPPPPLALVAPVARLVPPPAPFTTSPTEAASSFLFHVGKQMLSTTPVASVAQPQSPVHESTFAAGMRWTAFLFDAYAELRVIFRMYVDPRYQMSWLSRLLPLGLGVLLLLSKFWVPGTSLDYVGWLIDKVVDIPLAFLFFKVLSHEARRYRQTSPDLPYALRLPPDH